MSQASGSRFEEVAAGTADFFVAALADCPVLVVLRGQGPAEAVEAAEAAWAAGVPLVEVSLSHGPELAALQAVCRRADELGRCAGAGTVVSAEQVRAVAGIGAAFAVAPGLVAEPAAAAVDCSLPYLPGIATPSEAQTALQVGFRVVKLFPAAQLGVGTLGALRGPFPTLQFVAVGGIRADNAESWLDAGAIGVGIGSGLDPATLPTLAQKLRRRSR